MKKFSRVSLLVMLIVMYTVSPASANGFKDINANHSLKIEIDYLVKQGIINGYPDGTFQPNQLIQKQHIAKMMAAALDLPKDQLKHPNYKDVSRSHPYYEDIAALYTIGVFSDAPYFKPQSHISRSFMAKILTEAFNLEAIPQSSFAYKDVAKNHGFYTYIQLISMNQVAKGIDEGDGNVRFEPDKMLTRAHFSAFLARAMTLQQGDYTPNTAYNYYFFGNEDNYKSVFEANLCQGPAILTHWQWLNQRTGESIDFAYKTEGNLWAEGIRDTDAGTMVAYPFTIGLKHDTLQNPTTAINERQEIIDTNYTFVTKNQTFTNVVVLKITAPRYLQDSNGDYYYDKMSEALLYLAPNYGFIAATVDGEPTTLFNKREAR